MQGLQLECSICMDKLTYDASEIVYATRCGHIFHDLCLNEWIRRQANCPLCRSVIARTTNIRLHLAQSVSEERRLLEKNRTSSGVIPVERFKTLKIKSDREMELKKAVKIAIDTLTALQDQMKPIQNSEKLAEDSIKLSMELRSKLFHRGLPNVNEMQAQLKVTEQKVQQSLIHIEAFRDKMFVVNHSLLPPLCSNDSTIGLCKFHSKVCWLGDNNVISCPDISIRDLMNRLNIGPSGDAVNKTRGNFNGNRYC